MLTFIQIEISDLKKGIKYKIIEETSRYLRIFIGKYDCSFYDYDSYYRKQYLLWRYMYYIISPINDRDVPFTNPKYYGTLEMNIVPLSLYTRTIYKLVMSKEKIQCAMELRAVNIVLQNIIGDKMFKYY